MCSENKSVNMSFVWFIDKYIFFFDFWVVIPDTEEKIDRIDEEKKSQ